jgi:vacuolar protein sorting-associated protein 35
MTNRTNRYVELRLSFAKRLLTIFFHLHQVTTKYLNGLIELIHSNVAGNQPDSASVEASKKHFYQTLENIKSRQYEGVVLYPS